MRAPKKSIVFLVAVAALVGGCASNREMAPDLAGRINHAGKKYAAGYQQAAADSAKQLYWGIQRSRATAAAPGRVSAPTELYPVPGPQQIQTPNGPVNLAPHNVYIPVVEE
ncbi:MAG: hypothetical protein PHO89_01255 [Methylacidiphilaceae bacterium]|nr:hypothetical protein [Candidatus Methylacidiphilaceae bacterium]